MSGRDAPTPCRSLGQYVAELIEHLGESNPAAVARLRAVVGARRARITLDAETIEVSFTPEGLRVEDRGVGQPADGEGACERGAVLALLDGYLEVTDAILEGWLEARGEVEDVARMFQAIEILLDGSARIPALQELAVDFRDDPCRAAPARSGDAPPAPRRTPFPPDNHPSAEADLLCRLGLLP